MSDKRLNRTERERKWNEGEKERAVAGEQKHISRDRLSNPRIFIRAVYKGRHLLNHTARREID